MREHYNRLLEEAKLEAVKEAAELEIVAKIIERIDSPLDQKGLYSISVESTSNDKDFTIEVSRWKQPAPSSKESLVPLKETWRRITVTDDENGNRFALLLRDGSAEYIAVEIGEMPTFTLKTTLQNLQLFKEASEIVETQLT